MIENILFFIVILFFIFEDQIINLFTSDKKDSPIDDIDCDWLNEPIPRKQQKPYTPVGDIEVPTKLSGKYMSAEDKHIYLASPHWLTLKGLRLKIANHMCEHCPSLDNLELHHTTYIRLGEDTPGDVAILCRTCHQKLHDIAEDMYDNKYGRENLYPLSILDVTKKSPSISRIIQELDKNL